ncbi:MAG: hypothetical protein Q7T61_01035 [Caulobacter sp.]|nr:hypothetical protein [Caulobacter sp.]
MAYEKKPGDIAIFKEKNKTNDRAPDWKGDLITPSGEKLQIALWLKSDTMLAGKVEPPRQREERQQEVSPPRDQPREAFTADLDDEIPF